MISDYIGVVKGRNERNGINGMDSMNRYQGSGVLSSLISVKG